MHHLLASFILRSSLVVALLLLLLSNHHQLVVLSTRMENLVYNTNNFNKMGDRQKSFVLDTWLVTNAWVNPSMIFDPLDHLKIVMVWRVPDLVESHITKSYSMNSFNH